MSGGRVVLHGEDPGAMNFLAPLPAELTARGVSVELLLDGAASRYVSERGIDVAPYLQRVTPERLFDPAPPDFVLVGTAENQRTRAFELLARARAAGVETAGIVDLPANAAYRFRGESSAPLTHAPHWILVPDVETFDAFAALGVPAARLVRVRNPRFEALVRRRARADDRDALRARLFSDWTPGRQIVAFAAEPTSVLEPQLSRRGPDYTLSGRGTSSWRTAIVLEELLDALTHRGQRPYVVVRLHPKNAPDEFAAYAAEIDRLSVGGDPLDVLLAAHLVVGMSSMILQEAAILGTPVLSILPRASERAWLPMLERGQIVCATEGSALRAALALPLDRLIVDLAELDGPRLADFILERLAAH